MRVCRNTKLSRCQSPRNICRGIVPLSHSVSCLDGVPSQLHLRWVKTSRSLSVVTLFCPPHFPLRENYWLKTCVVFGLVLLQEGTTDHNLSSLFLLTTPDLRRPRRKFFELFTFYGVSRVSKVFACILNLSEQTATTSELTRVMTSGFENLISPLFLTQAQGWGEMKLKISLAGNSGWFLSLMWFKRGGLRM